MNSESNKRYAPYHKNHRQNGGRYQKRIRGGRNGGRGRGYKKDSAAIYMSPKELEDNIQIHPPTDQYTPRIAVQGCSHGELTTIYETLLSYEKATKKKIHVLLCCGDFQSLRNTSDYTSLAVPMKYRSMGTFHEYYSGEKKAPILTIFIGGNHENMKSLQELYYGGWVAPNIYYLGCAGVINIHFNPFTPPIRIAGLSGIYKGYDYTKGHYEFPPYTNDTLRSVFHVRNIDVYRLQSLKQYNSKLHIMLTHDWPRGIEQYGDTQSLLRKKKFFADEIRENRLGSPISESLLHLLQPERWFSGHLHVKFNAIVHHHLFQNTKETNETEKTNKTTKTRFVGLESESCFNKQMNDLTAQMTQFLALDKCLPKRKHLQIMTIPTSTQNNDDKNEQNEHDNINIDNAIQNQTSKNNEPNLDNPSSSSSSSSSNILTTQVYEPYLEYDLEWLTILSKTHDMTSTLSKRVSLPVSTMTMTNDDIDHIYQKLQQHHETKYGSNTETNVDKCYSKIHYNKCESNVLRIPNNFVKTVPSYHEEQQLSHEEKTKWWNNGSMIGNPQTDEFLDMLGLNHILTVPYVFKESIDDKLNTNINPAMAHDENEIDLDNENNDQECAIEQYNEHTNSDNFFILDYNRNQNPSTNVQSYDDNEIDLDIEEESKNDGAVQGDSTIKDSNDLNENCILKDENEIDI